MKRHLRRAATDLGFDHVKFQRALRGWARVRRNHRSFEEQRLASRHADAFPMAAPLYIYGEESDPGGTASGHYFHQDLLVAREVFLRQPERHIDVGSRIDGFVAHVASFRYIEVVDVRRLPPIEGVGTIRADIVNLPHWLEEAADSVSCLHALEHFGLGRYGDSVSFDGWEAGLNSLYLMVREGGVLYLSVPTSCHQRVEFNAHRIFSVPFLRDVLASRFSIESLSFVNDSGSLVRDVDPYSAEATKSFGAKYGCSIWILRKERRGLPLEKGNSSQEGDNALA